MRGRCPHFLVVRDLSEVPFFVYLSRPIARCAIRPEKVPSYRALRDRAAWGVRCVST